MTKLSSLAQVIVSIPKQGGMQIDLLPGSHNPHYGNSLRSGWGSVGVSGRLERRSIRRLTRPSQPQASATLKRQAKQNPAALHATRVKETRCLCRYFVDTP